MRNHVSTRASMGAAVGAFLVALLILGSSPRLADAHTTPTYSTANSKVLWIYFAAPIRRGTVVVRNLNGKIVSRGRGGRDPNNISALRVGLRNVRGGTYKARWSVISLDGHRQTGSLRFRVR